MKTYTVQTDQMLKGIWQQHARFDYKEAAAYAAAIVRQDPDKRVTVWDKSFEVVVNTRLGVETNADFHEPKYNYIATAVRNARDEA